MTDPFEKELRAAFEQEPEGAPVPDGLRQRVIANAVRTPQKRGPWWAPAPARWAPAVGALAVVILAGGVYLNSLPGGSGSPNTSVSPGPTALPASSPTPAANFGRLPAPVLRPPVGLGGGGGGAARALPYFGPANLTWAGQLPQVPGSAPVVRFVAPGGAEADAFASQLGAGARVPDSGVARRYRGPGDYETYVLLDDPLAPPNNFTLIRDPRPGTPAVTDASARQAAATELERLRLTPGWAAEVSADSAGAFPGRPNSYMVLYARQFDLGAGLRAALVNSSADPSGTSVRVGDGNRVDLITGTLPAPEESARYALRSPENALQTALTTPPLIEGGGAPVPSVQLRDVKLVYIAVVSAGQGYYEPVYLFSGTFTQGGLTLEKRVVVPAVGAEFLQG